MTDPLDGMGRDYAGDYVYDETYRIFETCRRRPGLPHEEFPFYLTNAGERDYMERTKTLRESWGRRWPDERFPEAVQWD